MSNKLSPSFTIVGEASVPLDLAPNNIDPSGMEGFEKNLVNIITPSIIIVSGFALIPIIIKQRKRKIGKGWEIPK